jgi:DNA replication and repair protein RecF
VAYRLKSGNTEAGPHRADVVVHIDGRRAEDEASRGQQKLVAAALILAQESVLSALHRGRGVLLVDDPAAELDAIALDRLLDVLSGVQSQLVFTGLTPIKLPSAMTAALFHVERGQLRAV